MTATSTSLSDLLTTLVNMPSETGDEAAIAEFVTMRLEGEPPGWDEDLGALRVPRALKHLVPCFRQAVGD